MSSIISGPLWVLAWVLMFAAFIWESAVIAQELGFLGLVLGIVLLPATYVAAPWYELIANGNPWLLVLAYVPPIVAGVADSLLSSGGRQ